MDADRKFRQWRQISWFGLLTIVVAACSSAVAESSAAPDVADATGGTVIEYYPDANVRAYNNRARAQRPVEQSAIPPRHLDLEVFPEALVDRTLIVSGGPPPDGIQSIDAPTFSSAESIDWIEDQEAVLVLELDGIVRVYPTQIMILHEIVNDDIEGRPVTVTYCPLCNSGVAFDREVVAPSGEPLVLDFGTSGSLYQSALVMYDRQTESLWTHFDGRAVVGVLVGTELELLPLSTFAWEDVRDAHPDVLVLDRPESRRAYGVNPYGSYDQFDSPLGGFFTGDVDPSIPPMSRVTGLGSNSDGVAVTMELLVADGVVEATVDGRRVIVWHQPGLASSLDASDVAGGRDIGAVAAFYADGEFEQTDEGFTDVATGSTWNVLGRATEGPRTGEQLERAVHVDTFWFAWSTYHPATELLN